MKMSPRLQKFALLAHVTFSVGWFGAVVPYLALVIVGLTSRDAESFRATYLSMELIGWYVIVPFSLAALLSGLLQSLGTQWGLLRHWWILAKLALTVFAVAILLQHMRDVSRVARIMQTAGLSSSRFRPELLHAAGGLLVLLAAMTLSVFKPWSMTPYGRRRASLSSSRFDSVATPMGEPVVSGGSPGWARIAKMHVAHAVVLALLFAAITHIKGMHHHGSAQVPTHSDKAGG